MKGMSGRMSTGRESRPMAPRRWLTAASAVLLAAALVAGAFAPQAVLAARDMERYMVGFRTLPDAGLIQDLGGEVIHSYRIVKALAVRLPEQAVEALAAHPDVAYVEPDPVAYAVGETLPWGVDRIDADVVQDGGNYGTGVKVAILDTGIDLDHPDLAVAGGATFVEGTTSPDDDNGHGTHVAGTVAALVGNGIGVIGVAPEAALYAVKVLDSGGSGSYSDIVAGIDWAVANGMQVINMSLGGRFDSQTLQDACDNAYAAGVLLVAAAGNSGNPAGKGDNVAYPARYSSVIAVAATDSSDKRASFSSTGPDVELAAPGVDILSTYNDGDYATFSGTSMASPHVAGVAALVIAANPDFTNVDVRNAMNSTAIDLGSAGRDNQYGYGLVYAPDAVGGGG
jgi:subtilisin family serine protease